MCEIKNKPYEGYIEKLKEPIELKGRVIKYKPVAKLSGKSGAKSAVKKGGMRGGEGNNVIVFLFKSDEGIQQNIENFLKNANVKLIVDNLLLYFRNKNTGIKYHQITAPQILFKREKGETSGSFPPSDLFETDRFNDLVRQLQLLLTKWKLVDINFSIFISEGDWEKKYTLDNAKSNLKTYSALDKNGLNQDEKIYNPGKINSIPSPYA